MLHSRGIQWTEQGTRKDIINVANLYCRRLSAMMLHVKSAAEATCSIGHVIITCVASRAAWYNTWLLVRLKVSSFLFFFTCVAKKWLLGWLRSLA